MYTNRNYIQFSLVVQSCLTLCDPMDCSMPGLPIHHQLPEFTQTHVHRVGDAIQPSHPLLSPSRSARNLSQHQVLFQCQYPGYDQYQFSRSIVSCSLWPHGLQHTRLPCPLPARRSCSNSYPIVSDAIQPSRPLLSPSPPAFNFSQHQGLFQWVSSLHQVAKVLEFQLQHQSSQ